jgi:putative PIN family toxin of toxin-antitoxin system
MNYVLDTCIIISALRSKQGASHFLLRKTILQQLPIIMHFKLLAEYRDVLSRTEVLPALIYTSEEIEKILIGLVNVAEEVNPHFLWRPNLKDEKDNFLVEIAVASQPCTIITHNVKDLLQGELLFPAVYVKQPQDVIREFFQ